MSPSHHASFFAGRRASLLLAACFTTAPALGAGVPIVATAQQRSVNADVFVIGGGSNDQDIDEMIAGTFGPFRATIDAEASLANGTATLLTAQNSRIAPFGIEAELTTQSASTLVSNGGFCYSVGGGQCGVTIHLSAPSVVRIRAELVAGANGQARLLINGPGGPLLQATLVGESDTLRTDLALPAGPAVILLSTFASTALSSVDEATDASFARLHLSTSADAADLDLDGAVGSADLALLLGAWTMPGETCAACPADLDGDGLVGATDLALLIGAWSA